MELEVLESPSDAVVLSASDGTISFVNQTTHTGAAMRVLETAPLAARGQARSHTAALRLILVLACTLSLLQFGCGGNANGNAGGNGGGTQGQLAGTWLGPIPGDQGLCGTSVGTWTFSLDGSYTFNAQHGSIPNSNASCADFLLTGIYSVQGSSINFNQQHDQTCPLCPQTAQYSVTYSFITTNDLQICDTQCYVYHRQ